MAHVVSDNITDEMFFASLPGVVSSMYHKRSYQQFFTLQQVLVRLQSFFNFVADLIWFYSCMVAFPCIGRLPLTKGDL